MHKKKPETGPAAFHTTFEILSHSYPTHFSSVNYSKQKTRLCKSSYWISYEVQLYEIILLLIQRNNLNLALFLNQK